MKNKDKDIINLSGTTKHSKKTYHQPELLVYGNLSEITRTVGVNGVFDNGLMVISSGAILLERMCAAYLGLCTFRVYDKAWQEALWRSNR
jgi:hypothetical protein